MSSTSATQETEKQHRVTCPARTCRKLLLKNGNAKCRSNHETSLVALQATRLITGETTHEDFMKELRSHLRFSELPPAHKRVREIMGNNFIALHEVVTMQPTELETYLSMLPIPFSLETLEETKDTHWLVPLLPWDSKTLSLDIDLNTPFFNALCSCHEEWRQCEVKQQQSPLPQWMLIAKEDVSVNRVGNLSISYSVERNSFIPAAAQFVYAHYIILIKREVSLIHEDSIWCKPLMRSNDWNEFPILSPMNPATTKESYLKLISYPSSNTVEARVRTARYPSYN